MKRHYQGLDFLRGLAILMVIILHTAFYFYKDIYDVDLENPSLIITLIGFLLMFAGLFAMISGMVHTIQYGKAETEGTSHSRFKYMLINGGLLMIVAYLYFIFTGPGLIMFETRQMDESIFVALINQGTLMLPSSERLFYVDSLVMLSLNIWLLALFFKVMKDKVKNERFVLIAAILFLVISYIRIPLYSVYIEAVDQNNYFVMVLLNWFVNKNNPIFPFFAFALFGSWLARLLINQGFKAFKKQVLIIAPIVLIIGIIGYILAPETMLERAIDPTWYFIMVMQTGLFMIMIVFSLYFFDIKKSKNGIIKRFISRFGVAGLTPFFIESTISAILFFIINLVITFELGMFAAIMYGVFLAILWGIFLAFWQKHQYKYGVEWFMYRLLNKHHESTKYQKLKGIDYD
jgi:hypothetical protein